MLEKINETIVRSSEGFEVETKVYDWILEYRENGRILQLDVNRGNEGFLVYSESAQHWNAPHEKETISQTERSAIVQRIKLALGLLNGKYTVL